MAIKRIIKNVHAPTMRRSTSGSGEVRTPAERMRANAAAQKRRNMRTTSEVQFDTERAKINRMRREGFEATAAGRGRPPKDGLTPDQRQALRDKIKSLRETAKGIRADSVSQVGEVRASYKGKMTALRAKRTDAVKAAKPDARPNVRESYKQKIIKLRADRDAKIVKMVEARTKKIAKTVDARNALRAKMGLPPLKPQGRPAGSGKKPAGKKPAGKKPAAKKPAGKKPAGKKPAGKKPAAKKPAGKKPAGKKPAGKKPAGKKLTPKVVPEPKPAAKKKKTKKAKK